MALAAPLAPATAQVRAVANLVIGDGVMVIKAGTGKHVYIGAAGSTTRTVTLTFDAAAVDEFVADAQALVAREHLLPHPVVERAREGRLVVGVAVRLADREAVEDRVARAAVREERRREGVIVAGRRAAGGGGVPRVGVGHAAEADARRGRVLPPVIAQIGRERRERCGSAVDVAVDHAAAVSGRP